MYVLTREHCTYCTMNGTVVPCTNLSELAASYHASIDLTLKRLLKKEQWGRGTGGSQVRVRSLVRFATLGLFVGLACLSRAVHY